MNPDRPAISILAPSYNCARFLPALCRSLQAQTCRDFEVLLGDDGSTDNIEEALAPFLSDRRFQLIRWKPNRGLTAAYLTLMERVRGEFYCPMAADDEWEPDFLEARLKTMRAHPQAAIVHGRTKLIDDLGQPLSEEPEFIELIAQHRAIYDRLDRLPTIVPSTEAIPLLLQHNFIGATSLMIRTSAARSVMSLLRFNWHYATDWSHWLLLLATGGDLAYDPRPLVRYRVHAASLSRDPHKDAIRGGEIRLVPLWALSASANLSLEAAERWTRWRQTLYALWLRRAWRLDREGLLSDHWLQAGATAFYGRDCGRVRLGTELVRHAASVLSSSTRETAARRKQFFLVSGLAQLDLPFYRK